MQTATPVTFWFELKMIPMKSLEGLEAGLIKLRTTSLLNLLSMDLIPNSSESSAKRTMSTRRISRNSSINIKKELRSS